MRILSIGLVRAIDDSCNNAQIYRRQSIAGQVDLVRLVLSLTEFE